MKHICKQVFSYAYENDLVDKNYADFLKIGAADKPKEKRSLQENKWNCFLRMIRTLLLIQS